MGQYCLARWRLSSYFYFTLLQSAIYRVIRWKVISRNSDVTGISIKFNNSTEPCFDSSEHYDITLLIYYRPAYMPFYLPSLRFATLSGISSFVLASNGSNRIVFSHLQIVHHCTIGRPMFLISLGGWSDTVWLGLLGLAVHSDAHATQTKQVHVIPPFSRIALANHRKKTYHDYSYLADRFR